MKKNRLFLTVLMAGASTGGFLSAQQGSDLYDWPQRSSVARIGDNSQTIGDSETDRPVSLTPDARPELFRSNAVNPAAKYIGHVEPPQSTWQPEWQPQIGLASYSQGASCSGSASCYSAPLRFSQTAWAEFDTLLWFSGGRNAPPLVTSHPTQGVPPTLDAPGTAILAGGNQELGTGILPGYRANVGMWLDDCQTFGVGGKVYGLFSGTQNTTFASTGVPSVGVPFFNTSLGDNFVYLVGFNDGTGSNVGSVTTASRLSLIAAEAYGRYKIASSGSGRIDLLGGYLFADLSDRLNLQTSLTDGITNAIHNGTVITTSDRFNCGNTFHGGQIGVASEWTRGKWSLSNSVAFALGNMRQVVTTSGFYTETPPLMPTVTDNRGFFVQSSNTGTSTRNALAFIPQIDMKLGYHIRSDVRFDVGYSFILFTDVVTAGDQIDTNIDIANILANPVAPQPRHVSDMMYLHGLSLGLTFQF